MEGSTVEKRDAPSRTPSTGTALARSRGLVLLGAMALLGWGLWRLGDERRPPPEVHVLEDPAIGFLHIFVDIVEARVEIRGFVLSRIPFSFDPRRSILTSGVGKIRRVVPGGTRSLLVHVDGSFDVYRGLLIPPHLLHLLRRAANLPPAEALAGLKAWAEGKPGALDPSPAPEPLRHFWK
ncbi:MAG TPA: hypothetical protein VMT52_17085 [Planctomycetota bacterium]|nr:hypothetical protein [Planctomycetota bacterium]